MGGGLGQSAPPSPELGPVSGSGAGRSGSGAERSEAGWRAARLCFGVFVRFFVVYGPRPSFWLALPWLLDGVVLCPACLEVFFISFSFLVREMVHILLLLFSKGGKKLLTRTTQQNALLDFLLRRSRAWLLTHRSPWRPRPAVVSAAIGHRDNGKVVINFMDDVPVCARVLLFCFCFLSGSLRQSIRPGRACPPQPSRSHV